MNQCHIIFLWKDHNPASTMNMANEIYLQLKNSDHKCPQWFVAGVGSGGTATSIARYVRKWADYEASCPANIAVVDPEDSVLIDWFKTGDGNLSVPCSWYPNSSDSMWAPQQAQIFVER